MLHTRATAVSLRASLRLVAHSARPSVSVSPSARRIHATTQADSQPISFDAMLACSLDTARHRLDEPCLG